MWKHLPFIMRYKTILFDLDGTLLNTLEDLQDAVNHVIRSHGYPEVSLSYVRDSVGNGARNLVAKCLPKGTNTPDFDGIEKEYRVWYESHYCQKTAPYEGVLEAIKELSDAGCKIAIISNKNGPAVKSLGEKFFPGIPAYGEMPGIPRKPQPDMIFKVMEELDAEKETTVYVGDSEVDVRTCKNGNLNLIAVSWGFRDRCVLEAEGADVIADNVQEFLEIVRNNR